MWFPTFQYMLLPVLEYYQPSTSTFATLRVLVEEEIYSGV